jgi:nucleoside-diphosphate-sugar epimerase
VNVLITGGAGYIGTRSTRQLARRGHHLRVYDLSTGHRFLALARDVARMGGRNWMAGSGVRAGG